MFQINILISAYACRPNMGSEPGVGWNVAQELAKYHQVWVLTRSDNKPEIEKAIAQHPVANLHFIYCDPPSITANFPPAKIPHYYCWQIGAYFAARTLLKTVEIDIIHHVTYVRYSTPSFLSLLPVPFVWGSVGGGEMAPPAFWQDFSTRGKVYEIARSLVHRLGELDPFTRMTARRSAVVRATTDDTAKRLLEIGANSVEVSSESGLSTSEIQTLAQCKSPHGETVRFISMARLLHWKGLHLSIRAFAEADLPPNVEYWILGDGAEHDHLQTLIHQHQLGDRVKLWGRLPRPQTLAKLGESHVLVHASLHDSGGWVCLEAMAAGRPVICLDLGGPAIQVTSETGIKVAAHSPQQTVADLSRAMSTLAKDPDLRTQMGQAGQQRVRDRFSWDAKAQDLTRTYIELCRGGVNQCVS